MRRMVTAKLKNVTGILNRFTSVLNRRQVNIQSISTGVTEHESFTNITAVVEVGSLEEIEQLIKQFRRLIDVIEVADVTDLPHVEREIMLIKLRAPAEKRAEIFTMVEPFRANVVDTNRENITIQMTGNSSKMEALIDILEPYGIINIARTGSVGLLRG